jgi:hypothetical protein
MAVADASSYILLLLLLLLPLLLLLVDPLNHSSRSELSA